MTTDNPNPLTGLPNHPRKYHIGDIVYSPAFANYDGAPVAETCALMVVEETAIGGYCPHYRVKARRLLSWQWHEANERYFMPMPEV